MDTSYPNTQLFINGKWKDADAGETIDVINPAYESVIGKMAHARKADLDEALEAADKAFFKWKNVNSFETYILIATCSIPLVNNVG